MATANETGAGQAEIQIAQNAAYGERARPCFQTIELPGGVTTTHHRADRRADDDVGDDVVGDKGAHHPNMREPARRAAAERERDAWPFDLGLCSSGRGFGVTVAAAHAPE